MILARRSLLQGALLFSVPDNKSIRIEDLEYSFEDYRYRTPYKFGGVPVDRVTLLNVTCIVTGVNGRSARGRASMPLGNVWSFPSAKLSYTETLNAMKTLAGRIARIAKDCREAGHPIDLGVLLQPAYLKAAADIQLAESIPKLCTLVTASPFDAAVHDAYGKLHGLNCYETYGPDFLKHDLSRYLGPDYKGEYLSRYIRNTPVERVAVYHSVGAADPIAASDITKRINDGLPETLPEWIAYNGLTHFKIKLNGGDPKWDIARVIEIDRAVNETQRKRGISDWKYSVDFNERCPNVETLIEFCRRVREKTPGGFERIQYIEQPTKRDLRADRANVMFEAAKLRPVVIDESLTDIDNLLLAQEMGYTGAALKACKGQTEVLLMAAVAQKRKFFLCVQDLTCPGASLLHSAGLAAHVPGVTAIEANAREYVPAANRPWEARFPGIFQIRDGTMRTAELTGPGLSAYPA